MAHASHALISPSNAPYECICRSPNQMAARGNTAAIADAPRNLVENALAHTAPGSEVIVEVGPDGALSVLDSGPGIPDVDRPRIFDRFWRGKEARTEGAGLG